MNSSRDWVKDGPNLIGTNLIDGLLAIAQGLLLIGLSALAMFVVYIPLSLAVITIFGVIGSICFLYGIEALRAYYLKISESQSSSPQQSSPVIL